MKQIHLFLSFMGLHHCIVSRLSQLDASPIHMALDLTSLHFETTYIVQTKSSHPLGVILRANHLDGSPTLAHSLQCLWEECTLSFSLRFSNMYIPEKVVIKLRHWFIRHIKVLFGSYETERNSDSNKYRTVRYLSSKNSTCKLECSKIILFLLTTQIGGKQPKTNNTLASKARS